MKKHLSTIVVVCIFVVGLSIFLYPIISNLHNENINNELISQYVESNSNHSATAQKDFIKEARLYNQNMYNKQKLLSLGLEYDNVLNVNGDGMMGYINIPKISVQLPIYHSLDENSLQTGLGHDEKSPFPVGGKGNHSVLAGHTGLPSAKLLTNIDQLEKNDIFYIHILNEVFAYRVDNIAIVEPNQTSLLQAKSGKDYVTIVTCTPYGVNTHRLLVRGVRVSEDEISGSEGLFVSNDLSFIKPMYTLPIGVVLIIGLFLTVRYIIKKRKK